MINCGGASPQGGIGPRDFSPALLAPQLSVKLQYACRSVKLISYSLLISETRGSQSV